MHWYLLAWQRYFDFSGRSGRQEFWVFMLFHVVITILFILYDIFMPEGAWPDAIYSIISFVPVLALITRRLHDIGRSGWWGLVFLLPAVGPVILICMLAMESKLNTTIEGL
ncbi:DUF805 domain-containing protein [Vibrio viridaestus]|uniref:DUF805 domain-containing protein n=1 Tax=Vibrio viridaestus TaxID=2487322 RepID=A0A3N9TDS9_9VIBR|nr:DUF805 domain-containing protein [Vibrio viridaestus]RQW62230.1 DUF805 domain-containing protein [Vibrio viridaestus]